MSTFKVNIVSVASVTKHPNADKLDLVMFNNMDWQVVTTKDNFKIGDKAVYFPVDSLLNNELEAKIFGPDAKVKLTNSRVKTIKLRGAISQGLAVRPEILGLHNPKVGTDVTKTLGVVKYEPPVRLSSSSNTNAVSKKKTNPNFRKYGGLENAKNYANVFIEGEEVSVTEKCHGSLGRCGWVPSVTNTFWKKIQKLFGFLPKYEFVYGSNNVELTNKFIYSGYYNQNVYSESVVNYGLRGILKPDEILYYEIYGSGIQKGYAYGCKEGERKIVAYDLKRNDKFLDPIDFKHWCKQNSVPQVPILYVGPFSKQKILELRDGPSVLDPTNKVKEGCVVKPIKEESSYIGRKVLKFISDSYLLNNQDFENEG